MKLKPVKIGDMEIDPVFAIPSGIITTSPDTCELFSREVYVGAVVTKSITPRPRLGNREPIFAQVTSNTFINAVGYTNPGSEETLKEFSEINPEKPVIASITAPSVKSFEYLARNIEEPFSAIEVVLSCPHTKSYGVEGGFNDPEITYVVTEAVVKETGLPVIVKFAPDTSKIKDLARAAKKGGASALSGLNTVRGTVIDDYTGKHILTNKFGGLSGKGMSGVGVECISLMRNAVKDLPIIGGLGNESARIGRQYINAGADVLYIGTALRAMSTKQINEFFRRYEADLLNNFNEAEKMVTKEWIMKHKPYKIINVEEKGDEIKVFTFDKAIKKAEPGQFFFTWLPRKAEKPFAIAYDNPLTLVVRKVGKFTSRMFELERGNEVMVRGPYGKGFPITNEESYLVFGGLGAAPMYFLATKLENPTIFMGATTEKELLFEREFSKQGNLIVSTDDGSKGEKGFVTNTLENYLCKENIGKHPWFYNCGPEIMMKKAVETERNYTLPERIFASVERYTPCGVGICGRCSMDGYRTCVDGPVFDGFFLKHSEDFGIFKRDVRGAKVPI